MGILQQMKSWGLTHHPRWLVALRVVLGLFLFMKGISFMRDMNGLEELVVHTSFSNSASWIALVVTWLHLLGGFLIIIGLFTRLAVVVQIPILLGAVIFINQPSVNALEFLFAFIILLLLGFFFVLGGGPISLDHFFSRYKA
ncbi:MAG TPA: DoxX family protein [Agriterribacter sp.]|nr:DoxX family protein [Agriterribacter sp.]